MLARKILRITLPVFMLLLLACAPTSPKIPVEQGSIEPGSSVAVKGKPYRLLGTPASEPKNGI